MNSHHYSSRNRRKYCEQNLYRTLNKKHTFHLDAFDLRTQNRIFKIFFLFKTINLPSNCRLIFRHCIKSTFTNQKVISFNNDTFICN